MAQEKTAEEWFHEGNEKYAAGDFDGAIESYDKAIELEPNSAETYNNRGVAWRKKKEYDKAIADYNKAIELKPDYAEAYNNRGVAWKKKKKYDKAIEDYNKAIELEPNDASAYNNRGAAWIEKKEYDKAIKDCNKALELKPDFAYAYNNRGVAWAEKKEYDKAIENYNKAIELKPDYAEAYNNRGVAWKNEKEYDKAIKDYDKAIELDPNFTGAIHNRGVAIALQAAEELEEQFKIDRARKEKTKALIANIAFYLMLFIFGIICAIFTALIMVRVFPYTAGLLSFFGSNTYFPIAEASAFGIISFPFIWALKQLKATEAKHRILSETFYNLAFIETKIIAFGDKDPDWQKEMHKLYITYRIKEGPEKLLLDLYQQKSDKPPATTLTAIIEKAINGKKD